MEREPQLRTFLKDRVLPTAYPDVGGIESYNQGTRIFLYSIGPRKLSLDRNKHSEILAKTLIVYQFSLQKRVISTPPKPVISAGEDDSEDDDEDGPKECTNDNFKKKKKHRGWR